MQIDFRKVNYSYNRKTPYEVSVLKNIDLKIEDSSFTAIIGKTGSGKSTLIEHINGLLLADSGSVKVGDYILENKKSRKDKKKLEKALVELRKDVAVLFQFSEQQLFETSVEKDIIYGPMNFGVSYDEAKKRAADLVDLVGLGREFLYKSPFELSGGEMRKVALCGVLAIKPKVLVLDEATIGLDYKSRQDFMSLIKKIHEEEKISIIFITHNMDYVLEYADNIVVMKEGEVVLQTKDKLEFLKEIEENDYNLKLPKLISFQKKLVSEGLILKELHFSYDSLIDELGELLEGKNDE